MSIRKTDKQKEIVKTTESSSPHPKQNNNEKNRSLSPNDCLSVWLKPRYPKAVSITREKLSPKESKKSLPKLKARFDRLKNASANPVHRSEPNLAQNDIDKGVTDETKFSNPPEIPKRAPAKPMTPPPTSGSVIYTQSCQCFSCISHNCLVSLHSIL